MHATKPLGYSSRSTDDFVHGDRLGRCLQQGCFGLFEGDRGKPKTWPLCASIDDRLLRMTSIIMGKHLIVEDQFRELNSIAIPLDQAASSHPSRRFCLFYIQTTLVTPIRDTVSTSLQQRPCSPLLFSLFLFLSCEGYSTQGLGLNGETMEVETYRGRRETGELHRNEEREYDICIGRTA